MKSKPKFAIMMVAVIAGFSMFSLVLGASVPTETVVEVMTGDFVNLNHITREIEVTNGGMLTVILGSNPATGFSWHETALIDNQQILQQTENKLLLPEAKNLVGTPGSHAWIFRTLGTGTTTITFEYSQPWEGKAEWTFELNVTIR